VLVVPVDPEFFRRLHGVPAHIPIEGPYGGALDNGGEVLELLRPAGPGGGNPSGVSVDRIQFNDRAPWPESADGKGPSLECLWPGEYGNDALNWKASLADGGTPGLLNTVTDPATRRDPLARFEYLELDEALTVFFDAGTSTDPDGIILAFDWDFGDGTTDSGEMVTHVFPAGGSHTVRLTVTDDDGDRGTFSSEISLEFAGGQMPGDGTQDGAVDLSDIIFLLRYLFIGSAELPCTSLEGSHLLLDLNGDEMVDIADPLFLLFYLYGDGNLQPALGTACVRIFDCPERCTP
jgi:hypothetical protein